MRQRSSGAATSRARRRRPDQVLLPQEAIAMIESAPAYFYVASVEDFSTLYRSPQAVAILGYSLADWADDPDLWVRLLHPDDRERVLAAFGGAARGGEPFRAEYRIQTRSGALRWVRDHADLVADPVGGGMLLRGVVLDITEEVEARVAAERARLESQAKSRFLAVMSHELRTPLNSILGFAQLLEMGVGGDLSERQRRYVDHVRASGGHLLALVNDVLDLAKVEAGRVELFVTDVAVDAAVAGAVEAVLPLARDKGLEVVVASGNGLVVRADERRLHQALLNLLANAIRFTDEGRITVEAALSDGDSGDDSGEGPGVSITVVDTGIGIRDADLDAIFDAFVQADGGRTREHGGTGLGLTLTRQFVEAMGGRVAATSRVGIGSRFTIRLPVGSGSEVELAG